MKYLDSLCKAPAYWTVGICDGLGRHEGVGIIPYVNLIPVVLARGVWDHRALGENVRVLSKCHDPLPVF